MTAGASTQQLSASSAHDRDFAEVYDQHFEFVWRSVRRLGVAETWAEDVAQEVFTIVYRRLPGFEARSSLKTWLFGITRNVVRDFRKAKHQRAASRAVDIDGVAESLLARGPDSTPEFEAARAEAGALVLALLDELDEAKREVFVLAELEEMTAPEIAEATETNLATVYTRIRAARQAFAAAVARMHSRETTR